MTLIGIVPDILRTVGVQMVLLARVKRKINLFMKVKISSVLNQIRDIMAILFIYWPRRLACAMRACVRHA